MTFSVYCLILGDEPQHAFAVEISNDSQNIGDLRRLIKTETKRRLKKVDALDLELWKVDFSLEDAEPIANFVPNGRPLLPTDKLQLLFKDGPEDHIRVIVKLPVSQVAQAIGSKVAKFHREKWNNSAAHNRVFKLRMIDRGESPVDIQIPDKCLVMKTPRFTEASEDLSGIFIRNEYVQAVKDIAAFYKGGTFAPPDGDDTVVFPTSFENPFLDKKARGKRKKKGVAISGSPGMGKSVLLDVLVALRTLAGLTTVLVTDPNNADVFGPSNEAARRCISDICRSTLPLSTWILVDSNSDLVDVPSSLLAFRRFIVQAASPRPIRLEWVKKNAALRPYFLKPWPVEEILAARTLQPTVFCEEDLEIFYKSYMPSARTAFEYASDPSEHEAYLDGKISTLEAKDIISAMNHTSITFDGQSPHQIFVLRPGHRRGIPLVQIATNYLTRKLFTALGPKLSHSAAELYQVFTRNKMTKGVAGTLLNNMLENKFAQGGYWPIHKLKGSSKRGRDCRHFKMDSLSTEEYLIVNGLNKPSFLVSDTPPAEGVVRRKTEFNFFSSTGTIRLVDGYYLPISSTQATFDSFYYNASLKQAMLLQFTTSNHHSMNVNGLSQLRDLGVNTVCYVVVTGPQKTFDLPVPNEYEDFVIEKYILMSDRWFVNL